MDNLILFQFIYCREKKPSANSEKKLYLQPEGLVLVYNLAGQMQLLSKLPPQSDICEWLATNS